jgi:CarD family transcriptional regulator
LKSGDVYQVAEVVRNLAARNRDASLSAAERTMYDGHASTSSARSRRR